MKKNKTNESVRRITISAADARSFTPLEMFIMSIMAQYDSIQRGLRIKAGIKAAKN